MYFGSDRKTEEEFIGRLKKCFAVTEMGHAHWFLQMRIHRYEDGSYSLDQMRYTLFLLDKHCPENSTWRKPQHRETPASPDYSFTCENEPKNEEEKQLIQDKYPGL